MLISVHIGIMKSQLVMIKDEQTSLPLAASPFPQCTFKHFQIYIGFFRITIKGLIHRLSDRHVNRRNDATASSHLLEESTGTIIYVHKNRR